MSDDLGRMRLITRRDKIREVPKRWRGQYEGSEYHPWAPAIQALLDALDLNTVPREEIDRIIGNDTWTELSCSVCEQDCNVVLRIEPSLQGSYVQICNTCAVRASNLFASAQDYPLGTCQSCGAKGFGRSIMGIRMCEFCDGSFGGHPPQVRIVVDNSVEKDKAIFVNKDGEIVGIITGLGIKGETS